jgi:hypothetical protein
MQPMKQQCLVVSCFLACDCCTVALKMDIRKFFSASSQSAESSNKDLDADSTAVDPV